MISLEQKKEILDIAKSGELECSKFVEYLKPMAKSGEFDEMVSAIRNFIDYLPNHNRRLVRSYMEARIPGLVFNQYLISKESLEYIVYNDDWQDDLREGFKNGSLKRAVQEFQERINVG